MPGKVNILIRPPTHALQAGPYKTGLMIKLLTLVFVCHKQVNVKKISVLQGTPIDGFS